MRHSWPARLNPWRNARAAATAMLHGSSLGEVPCALARYESLRLGPAIKHVDRSGQATAARVAVAGDDGAMTGAGDESTVLPVLTEDQLARLRPYGATRPVEAGEVLISPEDDRYDLLIVLDGVVEVSDESQGRRVGIGRVMGRGRFLGELSLLTGQRPFLTARAVTSGEILAITPAQFREVLARETETAEILTRALIARRRRHVSDRASSAVIEIIGGGQSAQALALRTFLSRNTIAYNWVDVDQTDGSADILRALGVTRDDLPLAITPTRVLTSADPAELAEVLGLGSRQHYDHQYDVVVVGAGPAGLAAAVYGASEGLDLVAFDATAPGGQAGTSSRIENYLGFTDGISGAELTTRATIQAQRFGAQLSSPCRVGGIAASGRGFTVSLADGTAVACRTVVAASGALYRRLPLANWERLEGAGIYYAATEIEAGACTLSPVIVLGGGNSAGQAALYLARRCGRVTIVIRRESLTESMSQYLVDRVVANDFIDVASSSVVHAVDGRDHLEFVELENISTGEITRMATRGLFCFIGAEPASTWLPADIKRDHHGFVLTDVAVPPQDVTGRPRLPFETTMDGVFAAGDIRVGSMKRVAAAVGEGSSVIRSVHQYLAMFSDRDHTDDPGQSAPAPIRSA